MNILVITFNFKEQQELKHRAQHSMIEILIMTMVMMKLCMYIKSLSGIVRGRLLTVNSETLGSSAGRCCSSSVSQSVRMVSCVSNYLQSLITDTAANKPQSAARRGRQRRDK